MAYDALGRCCRKTVNGERTFFTWAGDALLSERFEDQPAREYVYYPDTFEPLAAIDGDGQVYYYHNDPNGLPRELTRPNGEIVWSASYDHLGRVAQIAVNEVAQPLRLQGQYHDPELDLCYNRHRYFDPRICAFISQDPLGLAAGTNLYAYAPNVWGWVDPLGLCKNAGGKADFYANSSGKILPSTGYRYMDSNYAEQTLESMEAPLSYFGFEKFKTGAKAREAYQIFYEPGNPKSWSDARLRGEFDTLQLFDASGNAKVKVPMEAGGTGRIPEPITRYYTACGGGGSAQLVPKTRMKVKFSNVKLLPEN